MTADEIHDQNMREFGEALGVCAEALEKPQLGPYQDAVWKYENELLPLRKLADESEDIGETFDAYKEYDDLFNVMLEDMFEQVKGEAALLDAAPDLLKALENILIYLGDWSTDDEECVAAHAAIAKAKGVPAG